MVDQLEDFEDNLRDSPRFSEIQPISELVILLDTSDYSGHAHWFANVDFFDGPDPETDDLVVAGGSTICTVTVLSVSGDHPNDVGGSPIDCTATSNKEISFNSNPRTITFTLSNLTAGSATHWRAKAVGNMT